MQTSEQINEIGAALALAAAEIENVTKDAKNPHFKSTYATLAAVLDVCRPELAKQGICIVQSTALDPVTSMVEVETMLLHKSGQWLQSKAAAFPAKTDAQGVGAVTTYLRRYALAAMCGVAQEDDDGNSAAHGNSPQTRGNVNDRPASAPTQQTRATGANRAPDTQSSGKPTRDGYRRTIRHRIDVLGMSDEPEMKQILADLDSMNDETLTNTYREIDALFNNLNSKGN